MSFNSRWSVVPIGEVVDNRDSKRIPLKQADRAVKHGKYPYYGASGIIDYVDEYIFEGPHLLVGEDGANLLARSTPIAFMATGQFWVNNHAHVLGATDKIDLKYLEYFFATVDLEPYVTGSAQPKLNRKNLDRIPIPLPPLEEQRRIAAILDKADGVRRKRKAAIALTEDLLRAAFLDMFGDPVTNPKGWETKSLESISERIVDCPHSTPKWADEGIICLRTSNLTEGGWDWDDTRFVTEEDYKKRTSRSEILSGDIILSREGTVGIAAIVPSDLRLCMGQRLVQVRPERDKITSPYLLQILLWQLAPERIGQLMRGSTSQHLNVKDLRAMKVRVPPLSLQEQFAKIAAQLGARHTKLVDSVKEKDNLFNSLLQRAFRGEL